MNNKYRRHPTGQTPPSDCTAKRGVVGCVGEKPGLGPKATLHTAGGLKPDDYGPFHSRPFYMLLTTTGYCLPDLRQIQLTVMTIMSKGIYHTAHFYHVYLALYTDNLFINCSRLLLFTLIIPIILDFFFDCKEVLTCFHSSFSHCKI